MFSVKIYSVKKFPVTKNVLETLTDNNYSVAKG